MKDVVKNDSNAGRKRRGNYSIYYGMIGIIVIIIFIILSTTVLFRVNTVVIKGSSIYTADEITEASEIKGGNNLIRMSLSKSSEKIESKLVYIETAELRRVFPSTVEITVSPCIETASAEYEGKFFLLSASGKVLEYGDEPYDDTIIIYGAEPLSEEEAAVTYPLCGEKFECSNANRTEIVYQLIETASTAMSGKLNSFDMTDYLNISSVYDDRINIEFGSISEFDYKLKLASTIISSKIGPSTEGTLKMLSSGASFIDKAGLEYNEQVYLENSSPDVTYTDTEITVQGSENTNNETSVSVHFE